MKPENCPYQCAGTNLPHTHLHWVSPKDELPKLTMMIRGIPRKSRNLVFRTILYEHDQVGYLTQSGWYAYGIDHAYGNDEVIAWLKEAGEETHSRANS